MGSTKLNNMTGYGIKLFYHTDRTMNYTNKKNMIVKTHTYWMSVKQYKKHSKNLPSEIKFDDKSNTNILTRTHVYFV